MIQRKHVLIPAAAIILGAGALATGSVSAPSPWTSYEKKPYVRNGGAITKHCPLKTEHP